MNEIGGFAPETITGDYYYDPAIFELEKERIFYRTWQYVGHVSMLPEPSSMINALCDPASAGWADAARGETRVARSDARASQSR